MRYLKLEETDKKDTKFKPGKSGNPNGRPKLSEAQKQVKTMNAENEKAVRKMCRTEVYKHITENYMMPMSELKLKLEEGDLCPGEKIFIKFYLNLAKEPCHKSMELLLKMFSINVNQIDIISSDGSMSPKSNEMTEPQLKRIAQAFIDTQDDDETEQEEETKAE